MRPGAGVVRGGGVRRRLVLVAALTAAVAFVVGCGTGAPPAAPPSAAPFLFSAPPTTPSPTFVVPPTPETAPPGTGPDPALVPAPQRVPLSAAADATDVGACADAACTIELARPVRFTAVSPSGRSTLDLAPLGPDGYRGTIESAAAGRAQVGFASSPDLGVSFAFERSSPMDGQGFDGYVTFPTLTVHTVGSVGGNPILRLTPR